MITSQEQQTNERLARMRERLDAVSPSFCLAKWYQVTIHLQNGHTHSCHHPGTHLVPQEELAHNPSALHNTLFKKELRREMLRGVRPRECAYCWQVEDASKDNVSDRVVKSSDAWAEPLFDATLDRPWHDNVIPSYVEVSFSNVCNFKCSYCGPRASSRWSDEIKQEGPYPTTWQFNNLHYIEEMKQTPIPEREFNPYIEAFWAWWPDLYPKLKVFRITGGEPLLSKHTLRVLKSILENPRPDIQLSVNSNLGVPDELYRRFLDLVLEIVQRGAVKSFELYTSADAHGRRAEYIRNGLQYRQWLGNVRRFLETVPDQHLVVMSTFNALSLTSFSRLYEDVTALRREFSDGRAGAEPGGRIRIDLPYLRNPTHQSVMILPPQYCDYIDDIIEKVRSTPEALGRELLQLNRIRSMMSSPWDDRDLRTSRADFYRFFSEHDRRRGTSFLATFPEMASFWQTCRALAKSNDA